MSQRILRMWRNSLWLTIVIGSLLTASPVRGGLILEFGSSGSSPVSAFTVAPGGGTVEIDVYVRATDATLALLNTYGLYSANVKLTIDDDQIAAIQDPTNDIIENFAFDDAFWFWEDFTAASPPDPAFAELLQAVDDSVSPYIDPDAFGRIWLGTFRFTGGSAGTTTLSVTDWDTAPGAVDFQYYDPGTDTYVSLDDEIVPGTAQLTAAVPEPGSLGLVLAISGAGAVVAVYRRRRERISHAAA